MNDLKPIRPQLPNAERMILIPLCPTTDDFKRYLAGYCVHRERQACEAYADLQVALATKPQNIADN